MIAFDSVTRTEPISIEFLLKDPEVTEVMVNGPDDVYVERKGRLERAPDGLFEGEEAVLLVIERIVALRSRWWALEDLNL
jgi:Flp pilus assembly CpaF family ATPase